VDRDLVELARRGDREAFAILARSRGDTLFGVARRILRDVGLAEDAVQQTLVIAWRELPRLRDPDRFDAWVRRMLVHACYSEARRKRAWNANIRVLPGDEAEGRSDDRDHAPSGPWVNLGAQHGERLGGRWVARRRSVTVGATTESEH
jgi:DNA-directed RNA polymerase specialized sigma24 family protein